MTELHKRNNVENHLYTGAVVITSGLGSIFFFVNASKWSALKFERLNSPTFEYRDVNINEDSLFTINAILGVLLLGIFVWSILRIYWAQYPYETDDFEDEDEKEFK